MRFSPSWTTIAVCVCVAVGDSTAASIPADTLVIPLGKRAKVDGVLRAGEWADAESLAIQAGPNWMIPVLFKHDGDALYVAFTNLSRGRDKRYPEVWFDLGHDGGWDGNDWWLHASIHDCTGQGFYGVYGHTCAQDAEGWYANSLDNDPAHAIEFRISFGRFDLTGPPRKRPKVFGLAFGVSESELQRMGVSQTDEQRWFWPPTANPQPASWPPARLAWRP